jgi:hypothetical protein
MRYVPIEKLNKVSDNKDRVRKSLKIKQISEKEIIGDIF